MSQMNKFKPKYWLAKLHHPSRPKSQRSVHYGDEDLQGAPVSVATPLHPAQTHSHVTNEPTQTFLPEIHNKIVESCEVDIRELWDVSYEKLQQENPDLIKKYEDLILKDKDPQTALASVLPVGPMRREQMKFVLMRKMEQVNRDAWKLKFGDSTEVEVQDIVEPVLKVVDKANDFITNALDGNPQASIAWAGVSLLLPVSVGYPNATYNANGSFKLLLNPSKQAASLAKGLEYISRLIVQSQLREDLYVRYEKQPADEEAWKRSHRIFKDSLEKLYRRILCLQAEAYCYYSSNSALRLVRDMAQWDEWEALLTKVQEQEQAFIAVNELFKDGKYHEECEAAERRHRETAGTWKSIGADLSGLHKAIEEARSDQKRVELLDWLCKLDHSTLFNAARDKHQKGTNKWLIENDDTFKRWEKRPNSFLWLHGKAGSGKSIISSSVIEHIDKQTGSETALAYFFFSFTDPAKQSTDTMFSSLIKQLCTARPNTPKSIEDFHGRYKERGTRPSTEKLREAFLAAAAGFSSVHIVLDGLDECPTLNGERRKLLESLDRVVGNSPSSIHFLCTSRNLSDIADYMLPLCNTGQGYVIDVHNGVHRPVLDHDISSYIESTLESPDFKHLTPEIKKKVQDRLVESADGMFQYVYLQMDELNRAFDQDSVSQALDNLPMGLDETYQRIFGAIDEKYQPHVRRILIWLAFGLSGAQEEVVEGALDVMDLEILAELYAIRPGDSVAFDKRNLLFSPASILKMMPGLVVMDGNGRIRIAHYSIQQYLLSSQIRESSAAPFAFSESEAHFFIGHSWLALHIQAQNGGSLPSFTCIDAVLRGWLDHLNMVSHEYWPESVRRKVVRALAARSKSMGTILSLNGHFVDYRFRQLGYDEEPGFTMLRQPQCFTAFEGLSNLTHLLLSDGTNQYLLQDDLDLALHYAAVGGCTDVVEKILDMGAGINAVIEPYSGADTQSVDDGPSTALMAALAHCHLPTSELLLERGADINARGSGGQSSLQKAADKGNMDVVRFILKHGADIDAQDDDGCSALQAAISQNHEEISWLLYEGGANHKMLPLAAAVYSDNVDCLDVLIDDDNANIDQTGPDQMTALHKAAGADRYKDAFDLLLSYGADVNATSESHGTPLHQACLSGTVQYVVSLLEIGADLEASSTLWGTPLQAACRIPKRRSIGDEQSRLEIVQVLIAAGADINAQGGLYGNALQAAVVYGLREVMKLLLDHGANVNAVGGQHGTALQATCAVVWGSIDIARMLLEHGAEVNTSGGKYGCALQAACHNLGGHVVELLLNHGADPNTYGGYYGCCLSAAAAFIFGWQIGSQSQLQMLVEQGADVNYKGGRYGTPLQAACKDCWSYVGSAEFLLDHGADASAGAGRYGTPLHAIFMHQDLVKKQEDVVRLINALLQRGADINDTRGPGGITALQGLLERKLSNVDTSFRDAWDMVEYLLEIGADPDLGGGRYGFPLQSACALQEINDSGRAGRLLELCPKIDINAQGGYFHTSLQAAAYTAQTEPVRIMLGRGVDVNARGGRYGSALNAAVVQGFWDIAKTLMEAGAKPDCEIFSAPDQLWLWRLEEDDGRVAVRRYERFWEVESGQEIPVVPILAWLDLEKS